MKVFVIGGSPCTHWSIAQTKNRETEPTGIGYELFKNYKIAVDRLKKEYGEENVIFLYENNKSASKNIKEKIHQDLGGYFHYINSALVSAQNRQRFYVTNIPNVEQPKDKGILLKDILELDTYELDTYELDTCYYKGAMKSNLLGQIVNNGNIKNGKSKQPSQQYRVYITENKSICLNTGGQATNGHYLVSDPMIVKENTKKGYCKINVGECVDLSFPNSKTRRGRKMLDKSNCLTTSNEYYQYLGSVENSVRYSYSVKDGYIQIGNDKKPIKLKDGQYIIRKLSVVECEKLQTMPKGYTKAISNSQAYKALGNGWTADVITHILSYAKVPLDEKILVVSLYDGIATGRYCFDKMGYKNVTYLAYEIDKFPIKVAMDNYPCIIQMGNANKVREDNFIEVIKDHVKDPGSVMNEKD